MTSNLIPFIGTCIGAIAALLLAHRTLRWRWKHKPGMQFRFQLIMLTLTIIGALVAISALPVSETLRAQFLSLMGILISAAIAFASTNFIGNIMAGVMLKTIEKARPGDFITVEDLTGRITEMDLLHTEIQTEFRDLVTVPNSYMVSRPLKVVRASGSIITGQVSLGYDVSHDLATKVLREAAEASGLSDCFVHVRELGDFAVTYRAAGLLEDIHSLISAKAKLLTAMLDALHGAGIEVVSPTFMNSRALDPSTRVLSTPRRQNRNDEEQENVSAEALAFDKADDAAFLQTLRDAIRGVNATIGDLEKLDGDQSDAIARALRKKRRLKAVLQAAESAQEEGPDSGS